jgi:hypothetical protein
LTFRASRRGPAKGWFALSQEPRPAYGTDHELVRLRGLTGPLAKPNLSPHAPGCALERLQEDIMQAELKRGKAASAVRSVGRSLAILAGVPLIATLALSTPDRALAGACGAGGPTGVHAAGGGGASGVHPPTAHASSGGGSGGGGGTLGCAGGASAPMRGLSTAASGRVVERGVHPTGRTATHTRTAATRTANTGAHLRTVGPAHRG